MRKMAQKVVQAQRGEPSATLGKSIEIASIVGTLQRLPKRRTQTLRRLGWIMNSATRKQQLK
jgi:hypothetical protein